MRGFHWSLLGFLCQITTFSLAIPIDIIPMTRRSHFCANSPTTVAGTFLPRSVLPTLSSRTKAIEGVVSSMIYCAAGSRTYIVTTLKPAIAGAAILTLLDEAHTAVTTHLSLHGDGLIPGGLFDWAGEVGAGLSMRNSNNHQLTWGTLGAALKAVGEEMHRLATGGAVGFFTIVDGDTEVGTGRIYDGGPST